MDAGGTGAGRIVHAVAGACQGIPQPDRQCGPEEVLQYAWETVCYVIWGKASAKGGQKVVEAASEELKERYSEIFQ